MAEAIRLRICPLFRRQSFTIVSCSTVSEEIMDAMSATHPEAREILARPNSASELSA